MNRFLLATLICIYALPLCGAQASPEWKRIVAHQSFSFSIPADMWKRDVHGIDSHTESYRNPDLEISFDYGEFSSRLDDLTNEIDNRSRWISIDGKRARLVTYYTSEVPSSAFGLNYVAAVYFPKTNKKRIHLTMQAYGKSKEEQEIAVAIFRAIKFE